MALQILFGDDEHTAADGPYARVMKTRKWLYLTSAAAILVSGGWYNPEAMTALLGGVIDAQNRLLLGALAAGLIYLSVQYAMLVAQLLLSYEIVLKDRFAFRRQDELIAARQGAIEARDEAARVYQRLSNNAKQERARAQEELSQAAANLKASGQAPETLGEGLLSQIEHASKAIARDAYRRAENEVAQLRLKEFDLSQHPEFLAVRATAEELERQFEALAKQDPSSSRGYRWLERSVDALRVVPPAILASVALWHVVAGW